jgi:hypothetical protein
MNALFAENLVNSLMLTVTLPNFGCYFLYSQMYFWEWSSSILPNHRILIENPLTSEAGQTNDHTIACIANFCLLVNIFFWGGGRGREQEGRWVSCNLESGKLTLKLKQIFSMKYILFEEQKSREKVLPN